MSIETYGRYQLLKRLATGGMAQIYLARRQGPEWAGKLLVVKRILPHLTENEDFVKMFIDEARIAARLNHANVVQIFDLGAEGDSFFIAMEYIHGEDLRRLWRHSELRGNPVPVPLICRVLIEACAGLDYAHKRTDPSSGRPLGIVHRDVSPQNILVTFEGGVKVVDFGIAKAADQATITRSGVLKGKYSYMSPEQAEGQRVDCRSDIFALGVVLYELLTGTRLFKRPNDIQTLSAVSECRVVPPSQVAPRVPADLDAIVLKALAKDPAERYQEAAHLQAALEEWLDLNQLPASTAHLSAYMKELYAERLAEEALTGELLVGEPAPPLAEPAPPPASRRTGLRPSLPPRPPVPAPSEEDATASLRPGPAPKPAEQAMRVTGSRRALEPAASEPPKPVRSEGEPEPLRVTGSRRALEPAASEPPRSVRPEPDAEPLAMRVTGSRRALEPSASEPPRPGRSEAEAEPLRVTGSRRALEPAASERASRAPPVQPPVSERSSRAGLGAVPVPPRAEPPASERSSRSGLGAVPRMGAGGVPAPPPVEEDAPTLDGRAPRATLTDVKVAVETFPGPERTGARAMPQGTDEEEEEPTLDGRAIPRMSAQAPRVEEDAPTLAMLEPPRSSWPPPHLQAADDSEEDAPTLSLGMSRPARKDTSTTTARVNMGSGWREGRRPAWLVPGVGLAAAAVVGLLLWTSLRPSGAPPAPEPQAAPAPQVRFMADPWAEVSCGGKRLGQTPFETVELRVGTYDCTFFNPQLQKTLARRIEVKSSGPNVVSVKFE